jgi:hypothetical protein
VLRPQKSKNHHRGTEAQRRKHREKPIPKTTEVLTVSTSKSETERLGVRDIVRERMENNAQMNANERCWSLDKNDLVSLYLLYRDFFARPEGEKGGDGRVFFDMKEGSELYMYLGNNFFRAGLDCSFFVDI